VKNDGSEEEWPIQQWNSRSKARKGSASPSIQRKVLFNGCLNDKDQPGVALRLVSLTIGAGNVR